jgi:hypothetical protein
MTRELPSSTGDRILIQTDDHRDIRVDAMTDPHAEQSHSRESLELERLALENQKLRAELERRPSFWDRLQRISSSFAGLLAIAAFLFGVWQYVQQQNKELAARENELRKQSAARDQEFMKPLWDRELAAYLLASETVATIAGMREGAKRREAEEKFWMLYRGPLVIFETKALSSAMVDFGRCLNGTEQCSESDLNDRALAVSSAIQVAIEQHAALRVSEFSKDKFQYHR